MYDENDYNYCLAEVRIRGRLRHVAYSKIKQKVMAYWMLNTDRRSDIEIMPREMEFVRWLDSSADIDENKI